MEDLQKLQTVETAEKKKKVTGINFKITFENSPEARLKIKIIKKALKKRYQKGKVKMFQNYIVINTGLSATPEGVRRVAMSTLKK